MTMKSIKLLIASLCVTGIVSCGVASCGNDDDPEAPVWNGIKSPDDAKVTGTLSGDFDIDKIFKGLEDIDCYEENGLYKYTCGASNNYNIVYKRLKEVGEDFKGAFIIAFKNGEKINVNAGIREFKNNR